MGEFPGLMSREVLYGPRFLGRRLSCDAQANSLRSAWQQSGFVELASSPPPASSNAIMCHYHSSECQPMRPIFTTTTYSE
ncbi:MAG: hypothetical protein ACLTW6_05080 [Enterobacter sp.]